MCQIRHHNVWKKDNSNNLTPVFKTNLPSGTFTNPIYVEVKGLGCLVKTSSFQNSGRESINTKFFEVKKEDCIRIDKFNQLYFQKTNLF